MKARIVGLAVFMAVLLVGGAAGAQSFSCNGVRQCPELAICNTPELGSLDVEMAQLYFGLRDLSSRPAAAALLQKSGRVASGAR
jgi:uncharacterized protein